MSHKWCLSSLSDCSRTLAAARGQTLLDMVFRHEKSTHTHERKKYPSHFSGGIHGTGHRSYIRHPPEYNGPRQKEPNLPATALNKAKQSESTKCFLPESGKSGAPTPISTHGGPPQRHKGPSIDGLCIAVWLPQTAPSEKDEVDTIAGNEAGYLDGIRLAIKRLDVFHAC